MPYIAPPTLTHAEQLALLQTTRPHVRDHLIISLALGTGLRLAEIVGLNVGDLFFPTGAPRGRVRLRREIAKGGRVGDVFLPQALEPKLRRLWAQKVRAGESTDLSSPVFCSQSGQSISKRRVQALYHGWQVAAGFDRMYPFGVPQV